MNPSQGEKYLREMTKSGMRKLKSADFSNTMSKGGSILPRIPERKKARSKCNASARGRVLTTIAKVPKLNRREGTLLSAET